MAQEVQDKAPFIYTAMAVDNVSMQRAMTPTAVLLV